MKFRRAVKVGATFLVFVFGVPVAYAATGHPVRAVVWLAALAIAVLGLLAWFPLAVAVPVIWVLGILDAALLALRAEGPLRLLRAAAGMFVAIWIGVLLLMHAFVVDAFAEPVSEMRPTLEIGDHYVVDKLSPHWRSPADGELVVFRYPCNPDRDYAGRVIARAGETVEVRCNVVYINGKAVASQLVDATRCSYPDYIENIGQWIENKCSRYREELGGHTYEVFHDRDRPRRDRAENRFEDAHDFPIGPNPQSPSCGDPSIGQTAGAIVRTGGFTAPACEPQVHYVVPPDHVFVMSDNRSNSNDSRVWGAVPVSSIEGFIIGIWYSRGPDSIRWSRFGRLQ